MVFTFHGSLLSEYTPARPQVIASSTVKSMPMIYGLIQSTLPTLFQLNLRIPLLMRP